MKLNQHRYLIFLMLVLFTGLSAMAQQLAFPGAQGFGAYTQGGRFGKIVEVTNLNDAGPGSLREAIEAEGPRTVVFCVSGNIELKSMLTITNPFITIAGQTAPGDGICLKDFPLHIQDAHDVIVRFIRVRPGIASGLNGDEIDGIEVRDSKNIIIDHCTVSWTVDEGINSWKGTENITVQWCIIAEPLNKSIHHKSAHGFAGSVGGKFASYHHNLLAHAAGRNPSIGGNSEYMTESLDFRNNVVFNYGHRTCDGKPGSINFIANYYKPGPASSDKIKTQLVRIDNAQKYGFDSKWYIADNVVHGFPAAKENNWENAVAWDEGTSPEINRLKEPLPTLEISMVSAEKAYKNVLKHAGVIVPGRDAHEKRIVAEVEGKSPIRGNGIVDTVEQAGGWPELKSGEAPVDTDHDGMPDAWELKAGLDPNDPSDANKNRNNDGYTNVEEYLNSLVPMLE
ncbi:pectate lyase [Gaoshiqia sediminis]|uniref:Pectate lyase n=1 Tax=Gaoshiqia sediminis TaxID=2986998 RepID=A0AA41Y5D5_9BACT|nr:pectate lyase [Gaoshiqia sediminis]MCW0481826.1 pectate lyase [Gaoshiqia sediminis]